MKKILITGKNSYIGNSVKNWLIKGNNNYFIDTLCVKNDDWKKVSFSEYDVIFHVAGISHISEKLIQKELYNRVNTVLTLDIAAKAKEEGVKQFIFTSTMSVYSGSKLVDGVIFLDTIPQPNEIYGESKWQAEQGLSNLADDTFKVAILRPPMIYGKNSKGNYTKLAKLAKFVPIFPDFPNQRSMLHIDNLCEFVKQIIDKEKYGIFFPQNEEYVSTSRLVQEIAAHHGRKIILTKIFSPFIKLLFKLDVIKKLFGNLVYEKSISHYDFSYQIRNFKQSVELTEDKN